MNPTCRIHPTLRLALLGGCVLVAALVSPTSARVFVEDLLGPHALRPASTDEVVTAYTSTIAFEAPFEDSEAITEGAWHHEAGQDAP